jgi:L-ascorbate metabolism protein UlaG (beta-lactamase superfamily)
MSQSVRITYIGHATVLIEMNGIRLLTDPLLRRRVWHLHRRSRKVEPAWYKKIDAVLISHPHWDHLDLPSLRLLDRQTRLIGPQGVAEILGEEGFEAIQELSVNDSTTVGPVTVTATYADHDATRWPFGLSAASETLGFIIDGRYRLFFAGDTDLFPEMAELAEGLDVALLPVWGWGPNLGPGHMNPYRAAKALQLLRPRLAIPIHWGTFFPFGLHWVLPKLLIDPPHTFALFAADLVEEVKTRVIPPGKAIDLADVLVG